jgi:hypothetical protein
MATVADTLPPPEPSMTLSGSMEPHGPGSAAAAADGVGASHLSGAKTGDSGGGGGPLPEFEQTAWRLSSSFTLELEPGSPPFIALGPDEALVARRDLARTQSRWREGRVAPTGLARTSSLPAIGSPLGSPTAAPGDATHLPVSAHARNCPSSPTPVPWCPPEGGGGGAAAAPPARTAARRGATNGVALWDPSGSTVQTVGLATASSDSGFGGGHDPSVWYGSASLGEVGA